MGRKLTTTEFIIRSKNIHKNKYDYSLIEYINNYTKVIIICKKHGKFLQTPKRHLSGQTCMACYQENRTSSNEQFIIKAKLKHNNIYNYSHVKYKNAHTKVDIFCYKHGIYTQTPNDHLSGKGCHKCSKNRKLTTCDFIKYAKNVHGDKYDYSLVKYINSVTKVKIICTIHNNIFEQRPSEHIIGKGCSICNSSKGEILISKYLMENNISYYEQKTFTDCKHKNKLSFDFYLPEYNILIEFDGKQHFIPVDHFGGKKEFELRKKRDDIKNKYCVDNNIKLIRIPYNKIDNINDILTSSI